jgi:hypothetical protein
VRFEVKRLSVEQMPPKRKPCEEADKGNQQNTSGYFTANAVPPGDISSSEDEDGEGQSFSIENAGMTPMKRGGLVVRVLYENHNDSDESHVENLDNCE